MTNQSTLSQLVLSDSGLLLTINKSKQQGILYEMGHCLGGRREFGCCLERFILDRPWSHGKLADPDPEGCDPGSEAVIPDPNLF